METTPKERIKEKSVIIHRDENGFGLRVSGQEPVFVEFVHENGAAWKAGVRKGDCIIKVNGTLVRTHEHKLVVHMIQECTRFVNLTLHTVLPEPQFDIPPNVLDQPLSYTNNLVGGLHLSHSSNSISMINNNSINSNAIQAQPMHQYDQSFNKVSHYPHSQNHRQHHPHPHQRRHHSNPHSMPSNWLMDIADDIFQDNQGFQQRSSIPSNNNYQLNLKQDLIPATLNHGVSKLIVSGPNLSMSSSTNSINNGGKELRLGKQQQTNNIVDNPYYYYKTAPDKGSDTTSTCTSSTAPLLSSHSDQQQGTSAKSSAANLVSRSSSKMSIRSTTGKYKPRNLRSRLVGDLRAFTITNSSQVTPSSLSTSPSSSDLSDCDDLETSRLDCLTLNNNSSLSNSPGGGCSTSTTSAYVSNSVLHSGAVVFKSKITTRRLEIIRELVETEKTHIEKLKQLNDLLYKPIKAENLIPADQLKMVFSCHKTLFKIHRQIYKKLIAAQMNVSEVHQEPLVGKALIEIFDGELGKRLEKAASLFCACQSTNSDLLNRITRKDTKSGEFLAQVATQQMLGRLGIKDLLASCFQRLTKYPLLLDNLLKATLNTGSSGMMHSKSLSESYIHTANESSAVTATLEEIEPESESQDVDQSTVISSQPNVSSATVSKSNSGASESTEDSENETNDETITKNLSAITPTITTIKASTSTLCANDTSILSSCSHLSSSDEYAYERLCIDRALLLSRQILIHVNEAVNKAVAQKKLRDVWKKTVVIQPPQEKSQDKSEEKKPALIPVIDIETQQLIHQGSLTLRIARRSYEVYVVLLAHYLVILTREGQDKYKLKYFTLDSKPTQFFSPIFEIDEHLVTKDLATDDHGFYILYKRKDDARMYEFASHSPAERSKWKEKIHLAQLYNYAIVPEDDNTLTRYKELISLTNDPVDEAGGGKLIKVESSGLEEKIRQ